AGSVSSRRRFPTRRSSDLGDRAGQRPGGEDDGVAGELELAGLAAGDGDLAAGLQAAVAVDDGDLAALQQRAEAADEAGHDLVLADRKSTRLNSSHVKISYA